MICRECERSTAGNCGMHGPSIVVGGTFLPTLPPPDPRREPSQADMEKAETLVQPVKYFLPTQPVYEEYVALIALALDSARKEGERAAVADTVRLCRVQICTRCEDGEPIMSQFDAGQGITRYRHYNDEHYATCAAESILHRFPEAAGNEEEKG